MLELNNNDEIDYTCIVTFVKLYNAWKEFVVACIDRKNMLDKKNLKLAFNLMDNDGNGSITVSEIKSKFKN